MAQNVLIPGITGRTMTSQLFSASSDTAVATASSVTEQTNRKGLYLAAYTGVATGTYWAYLFESGVARSIYKVDIDAANGTFNAKETSTKQIIDDIAGLATAGSPNLLTTTTIASIIDADNFTLTGDFSTDDSAYADAAYAIITKNGSTVRKATLPVTASTSGGQITVSGVKPFTLGVGDTVRLMAQVHVGTYNANLVSSSLSATALNDITQTGQISRRIADTWAINITSLGNLSSYQNIIFVIKESYRHPDSKAVLLVDTSTGLRYINKAAATGLSANASITPSIAAESSILVSVNSSETAKCEYCDRDFYYAVKWKDSSGNDYTIEEGNFTLNQTLILET